MALDGYFDEHNCQELADGQTPDHVMHFARLLIDTGHWNEVIYGTTKVVGSQPRSIFLSLFKLDPSYSILQYLGNYLRCTHFQEEFSSLFNEGVPPPTSKKFLGDLEDIQLVDDEGKYSY